jgi:hypothetical protein
MKARNPGNQKRFRAVIARTRANCHICGEPIDYTLRTPDPRSFVIDHVIPLHLGGADALSNVRAAHRRPRLQQHEAGARRRTDRAPVRVARLRTARTSGGTLAGPNRSPWLRRDTALRNVTCATCGTGFTPVHSRNRYCSKVCRQPEHPKVVLLCDCCGGPAVKYRQAQRWGATYCSLLCRDYTRWGPRASRLPKDHIARWVDQSCAWTPPLIRNTGECEWCGTPNPRTRTAAFCSVPCKVKAKRVRRIGRQHLAEGTYSWREVTQLWLTFDKACAYCQQQTPLSDIQAEHVQPLSRGGRNDLSNLLPSCGPCNSDKRDIPLRDWNADRARRGLAPRTTSWDPSDRRYWHLHIRSNVAA